MKNDMTENKNLPKVGVIGSGSFATAVVKMLMENCEKVHWLLRNDGTREALISQGSNPHYLTAVKFNPDRLVLTMDINKYTVIVMYIVIFIVFKIQI